MRLVRSVSRSGRRSSPPSYSITYQIMMFYCGSVSVWIKSFRILDASDSMRMRVDAAWKTTHPEMDQPAMIKSDWFDLFLRLNVTDPLLSFAYRCVLFGVKDR
jgi:hypothetical protein